LSNSHTTTNSFSTRIAYTEPISKHFQAQAIYNPSTTRSNADARAFQFDPKTQAYTLPDSQVSNSFDNRSTQESGGLSVLFTSGTWRLLGNTTYQYTRLESDQSFPATTSLGHSYDDVLPSLTLTGTFAGKRNLRLAWNTSTTLPTIGQLQNVVNNSNPLSLSAGNPALQPRY